MPVIRFPDNDITLTLSEPDGFGRRDGKIISSLKESKDNEPNPEYDAAIDGLEALILALGCQGVNMQDRAIEAAINDAVDAIVFMFD
jgi:hypothetical protein